MSGLPQGYGVPFPGVPSNAYPPSANTYATAALPQQQVAIQPGSITYTTTPLPDGRVQYNQFRAEPKSYSTPQGPVHGIQWVPVNISYEPPLNAQPAGPDFHAAWSRHGSDKDAQKVMKEWQREQEKKAKREEKEAAKRMKEWERDRREREKAEEKELRRAQERDLRERGRRLSNAGIGGEYSRYPDAYGRSRSHSRTRPLSSGHDELTRAMAEMVMDNEWPVSEGEGKHRERRSSNVGRPRKVSFNERVRGTSVSDYERSRKNSGTPYPTAGYVGSSAYYGPPSPGRRHSYSNRSSPYMSGPSLSSASGPVYPPGHIYAGKPIPGMQGENLGAMTASYPPPSPRRSSALLDSPAGFSRLPSQAALYTYFDPILILPDMDELIQHLPLMPAVLEPHDVRVEDWMRCFQDIARLWIGEMPVRDRPKSQKNYNVVGHLMDVWNASFFSLRGVELVLYRGKLRYSGPHAGRYDKRIGIESSDESETISSVSSDSDADERYAFYGHSRNPSNSWLVESMEARHERRAEKRRLREKHRKRRDRERETERRKGFRLFLMCVNDGQPRLPPNAGYPPAMYEGHSLPYRPGYRPAY